MASLIECVTRRDCRLDRARGLLFLLEGCVEAVTRQSQRAHSVRPQGSRRTQRRCPLIPGLLQSAALPAGARSGFRGWRRRAVVWHVCAPGHRGAPTCRLKISARRRHPASRLAVWLHAGFQISEAGRRGVAGRQISNFRFQKQAVQCGCRPEFRFQISDFRSRQR